MRLIFHITILLPDTQVFRITLTYNEIKDFTKVIGTQKNRERNYWKDYISKRRVPWSSMRLGSSLVKNVQTPFAKNILLPLKVTAAASAIDAAIQKKVYGSGKTTLIIWNEEIKDTM